MEAKVDMGMSQEVRKAFMEEFVEGKKQFEKDAENSTVEIRGNKISVKNFDNEIKKFQKKIQKAYQHTLEIKEKAENKLNKDKELGLIRSNSPYDHDRQTKDVAKIEETKNKKIKKDTKAFEKLLIDQKKLFQEKENLIKGIKELSSSISNGEIVGKDGKDNVEKKLYKLLKLEQVVEEAKKIEEKISAYGWEAIPQKYSGAHINKSDIPEGNVTKYIKQFQKDLQDIYETVYNKNLKRIEAEKKAYIEKNRAEIDKDIISKNTGKTIDYVKEDISILEDKISELKEKQNNEIKKLEQQAIKSMEQYLKVAEEVNVENPDKISDDTYDRIDKAFKDINTYVNYSGENLESLKIGLENILKNNPNFGSKNKKLYNERVEELQKGLESKASFNELIEKYDEAAIIGETVTENTNTSLETINKDLKTNVEELKKQREFTTKLKEDTKELDTFGKNDNTITGVESSTGTSTNGISGVENGKTPYNTEIPVSVVPEVEPEEFVSKITEQLKGHSVKVDVELNSENITEEVKKITEMIPDKKEIEISVKQDELYTSLNNWKNENSSSSDMGIPEQIMAVNTKTGYATNPNIKGEIAGISNYLINEVIDSATETVNAVFHSHPDELTSAFSFDDIEMAAKLLSKGITEQYVVTLNDIAKLDLSKFTEKDVKNISDRLKDLVMETFDYDGKPQMAIREEEALMNAFNKDLDLQVNRMFNDIFSQLHNSFNGNAPIDLNELNNQLLNEYNKTEINTNGNSEDIIKAIRNLYNKVTKSFNEVDVSKFDIVFSKAADNMMSRILQEFQEDMLKQAISEVTPHINPDDVYKKLSYSDFKNQLEIETSSKDIELNPVLSKTFDANSFINEITNKLLGKEVQVDIAPSENSEKFLDRISAYSKKLDVIKDIAKETTPKTTQPTLEGNKQYDNSEEIASMSKLKQEVDKVTTSVDEKTNAFREEEQVVAGEVIPREISELERLSGELVSVRDDIEKITSAITTLPKIDFDVDLSKLNIENIDGAAIASFNTFREQLAGLEAQLNVSNLSEKLVHISEAFERLSRVENLENLNTKNLKITPIVQLAEKAGSITELVEALNRLKECLDGLKTASFDKDYFAGLKLSAKNVNNMADMAVALETVGIALQKFDADAKESLSSINELLDKSEALKSLSSVIKTPKKTKEVKEVVDNEPSTADINKNTKISDNISNGTYQKDIDEVTERFGKLNKEIKYNEDLMKQLNSAYDKLKNADGVENKIQAYREFEKALASARNELLGLEKKSKGLNLSEKLNNQLNEIKDQYSGVSYLSSSLNKLEDDITAIQEKAKVAGADLTTLAQDARQAFAAFSKGILPSGDVVGSFNNLDEAIEQAKSVVNQYGKVKTELKTPLQVNDNGIAKMTAQVVDLNGELKTLTFVYNDVTKTMVKQTTNIRKELSGIPGVIDAVKSKLKDMAVYWTATMFDPSDIMFKLREIADVVIDLNTQMTELAKVSGLSIDQLEGRFNDWANTAKDLGATISDTISAAADWSRLGYSVDEAERLAEVSILYRNVGDGIDIDQANESLVSTLQGFQMEASQAESIIDSFNEVSNNFAISSGGIGEALQRSAASFYAANTDLNSAISLITATNSVIQDPTRVGKQHIAYLYSNVMIIKVAILVKNQRWLRPRKDYNICFNY